MIWNPVMEQFIQNPLPTYWRLRGDHLPLSMTSAHSTGSRETARRPPLAAIRNLRQRVWHRTGPSRRGQCRRHPSYRGVLRAAPGNGDMKAFLLSIASKAMSAGCADR
jgi:hypothetical protein